MKDLVTLESTVVELSAKSKTTKEAIMLVHKIDIENSNGLTISLASTEKYKDTLVNKPVVVKLNVLETDFLGHEPLKDKNGNIISLSDTIAVGTITETWIEDRDIDNEIVKCLMCKAVIWSYKYPTVVEVMQNLFDDGNLTTSVEIAIMSYSVGSRKDKHRTTKDVDYLSNCMLGSTILPADKDAGVIELFWKEVAQALQNEEPDYDIGSNNSNGGVIMLSHDEIKSQLRALLNPNDNKEGGWVTDYWTWDMVVFDDFCVARQADSGKLMRFDYEIKDEATVSLVGEPREQMIQYVDVPTGETIEVAEWVGVFKNMQSKVKELEQTLSDKDLELNSLTEQKGQLETEIAELKTDVPVVETVVNSTEKDEALIVLNSQINALQEELNALRPIKADFDRIQAEKAETELNEKRGVLRTYALNSKVIEVNELEENEQLKTAIFELNESFVKCLISDRIVEKAKAIEVETNSKETNEEVDDNDDVAVSSSEPQDLIPQSIEEKYGLNF